MPSEWAVYADGSGDITSDTIRSMFVFNETPVGEINSSNRDFLLEYVPNPSTSLMLTLNGLLQREGISNDYTLSGLSITFVAGNAPITNSSLLATYMY